MRKIKIITILLVLFHLLSHSLIGQTTISTDSSGQKVIKIIEKVVENKESVVAKVEEIKISQSFYISLAINLASVFIILLLVYYPNYRKPDYLFTFAMFNIVIFLLTYVLNQVTISLGAAFGLFAVFSMLRYRTTGISMKDMTYLFIFIALGLVSAIKLGYVELAVVCGLIVVFTYILDGNILIKRSYTKEIKYEKIEMIKPENNNSLIEDLRNRTGLKIHRVSISKIDFLTNSAEIKIYYYE